MTIYLVVRINLVFRFANRQKLSQYLLCDDNKESLPVILTIVVNQFTHKELVDMTIENEV